MRYRMRSVPAASAAAFLVVLGSLVGLVGPSGAAVDGARQGDAFPATIALPRGLQPEGITSGPGTTFYTGSLADGRIYRGDLRTGRGAVLVRGEAGGMAVGMEYDRRTGRLWVAGGATGTVTAYDAASGRRLARYPLAGSGFLNDVAITRDGVYVTDSFVQRLAVVPLGRSGELPPESAIFPLPLTGEIRFTDGFNANGITALRRDRLILVQSNTATLFTVDPASGRTRAVPVRRGEIAGGDGLELKGNRLYVVRGGGGNDVAVLRLRRHGSAATFLGLLTDPTLDVPTTATFRAGRLWAVNARFGVPSPETATYSITSLPKRP